MMNDFWSMEMQQCVEGSAAAQHAIPFCYTRTSNSLSCQSPSILLVQWCHHTGKGCGVLWLHRVACRMASRRLLSVTGKAHMQAAPGKPWAYAGYKVTVYSNNEEMLNDLMWWDTVPKVGLLPPGPAGTATCYGVYQALLHVLIRHPVALACHRTTTQEAMQRMGPWSAGWLVRSACGCIPRARCASKVAARVASSPSAGRPPVRWS